MRVFQRDEPSGFRPAESLPHQREFCDNHQPAEPGENDPNGVTTDLVTRRAGHRPEVIAMRAFVALLSVLNLLRYRRRLRLASPGGLPLLRWGFPITFFQHHDRSDEFPLAVVVKSNRNPLLIARKNGSESVPFMLDLLTCRIISHDLHCTTGTLSCGRRGVLNRFGERCAVPGFGERMTSRSHILIGKLSDYSTRQSLNR